VIHTLHQIVLVKKPNMCGIAGVLYADSSRPPDKAVLKAMGMAIAHRGPDAEGFLIDPGLGFVHRRLSIIDLTGGDQPVANEDDSVQVVLNGEIYNYRELTTSLLARGHRFRTHSDTEVLVHLYEEYGEHLVERLRGMFAFALWDRRQRRLLLARDRIGIKPLYIYRDPEKLLFASELKGILAHPQVRRELDPAALDDYLAYGMVPGSRAIFQGVEKLLPAHTLLIGARDWNRSPRQYWQLQYETDEVPNVNEWQDTVRTKVEDAVRAHMVADVPVGAFLSGGVDSAVVVSCGVGLGTAPLQTFSLGFREEGMSELPAARAASVHFGTHHTDDLVTPDAAILLGKLTHYFDEPFADSSALPTFLLAQLARRGVKVALSGDGGDEAFGGYTRYAHDLGEAAVRRCLPAFLQRALRPLANVWPKFDWLPRSFRAKTFLTNVSLDAGSAYANTIQICRLPQRGSLLAADVAAQLNGHRADAIVSTSLSQAPPGDALAGMIAADIGTLLPDDYLVKVDRASMAHGLEVRPPLLDHVLLELAVRIPSRFKIHRGETKWLFKKTFRDRLPTGTIGRRKQGFEIPIDAWMRGPLCEMFESTVLVRGHRVADLIDQSVAGSLYRSHQAGVGRHGAILWTLLVLAQWCDRYLVAA
jgi:asparagine synthase (glutamine-hydrolysing)